MNILLLSGLVSLIVTLVMTPLLIRYLKKINLFVKDMNKKETPLIPVSGGIAVVSGIISGLLFYIFVQTFIYKNGNEVLFILAAICSILIITFIGFVDDLFKKYEEKTGYTGLKQWQKPLLVLPAAIPLMAVNAGVSEIYLPIIHKINVGILYSLVFVPIAVIGASNMVNLLEGFNGLAAGMGIIYTGMLGLFALKRGEMIAASIAFVTFGALLAFYIFNKYPSRIFPGDSLTYLLGAVIACIAILGNIEKAALIASGPFFIEFVLKLRGGFKKQSYGYYKDGKVKSMYDKIYSLPHIFTRNGKFTEKQIVYFMMLIELVFAGLIWVL